MIARKFVNFFRCHAEKVQEIKTMIIYIIRPRSYVHFNLSIENSVAFS